MQATHLVIRTLEDRIEEIYDYLAAAVKPQAPVVPRQREPHCGS